MLKARMQKARRLLDLHRDLQRLEEERIAGLRRRQAELAAEEQEAINSLNNDAELQGLFVPVIVKRLTSLGDQAKRLSEEIERRTRALRALAARTKSAERLSRSYEQQHTRAEAQKELLDIIERITQPKDASLP